MIPAPPAAAALASTRRASDRLGDRLLSAVTILASLASAALMAWYNWKLFLVMMLLAPLIWVINEKYRAVMSSRLRKVQETWSRLSLAVQRVLSRQP